MNNNKKSKIFKWSIILGLIILIIFVIVTSIILHFKKQQLKELENKSQIEENISTTQFLHEELNENDFCKLNINVF